MVESVDATWYRLNYFDYVSSVYVAYNGSLYTDFHYNADGSWYVPNGSGGTDLVVAEAQNGICALWESDELYVPMIAYRVVDAPPDEGGSDDDDPQPPRGVADI